MMVSGATYAFHEIGRAAPTPSVERATMATIADDMPISRQNAASLHSLPGDDDGLPRRNDVAQSTSPCFANGDMRMDNFAPRTTTRSSQIVSLLYAMG